jgi:hypothetical protein
VFSEKEQQIPNFDENTLQQMVVPQLRKICDDYNIRKGTTIKF